MKLKPCPFCGSDEAWCWEYESWWAVRCRICGMGNEEYDTRDEAEKAWNRRA